nr:YSIRK-type signal peptide-containing protein [Ligilactobacillus salivarius]
MFSKNNKKMIAERSAERTLKYGLVKLNVGLASVLLATGLTFAGGQAASADTVTTNTEAQTTEVAPGQNDATTEATETTNKADAATQTENQGLNKRNSNRIFEG